MLITILKMSQEHPNNEENDQEDFIVNPFTPDGSLQQFTLPMILSISNRNNSDGLNWIPDWLVRVISNLRNSEEQ